MLGANGQDDEDEHEGVDLTDADIDALDLSEGLSETDTLVGNELSEEDERWLGLEGEEREALGAMEVNLDHWEPGA